MAAEQASPAAGPSRVADKANAATTPSSAASQGHAQPLDDQRQTPNADTSSTRLATNFSSDQAIASASDDTRSFSHDSDPSGSTQSAAPSACPSAETSPSLAPSSSSHGNTYDETPRDRVTERPGSPYYPPPLPVDDVNTQVARFRPSPREIISGFAPHVFDERKRRPSQPKRATLPSWSYYNRRPRASPLRKSVVAPSEEPQPFHAFPVGQGYFRVYGINTRKPRTPDSTLTGRPSPRPSLASLNGASAKPKPTIDTSSTTIKRPSTAPALASSTSHADLRASIIDLNLDGANGKTNPTSKPSSPTLTTKFLFKMGAKGVLNRKAKKKRSQSMDCPRRSPVSSSSSSVASSRSSMEESLDDLKFKRVLGLDGGVPLVRTISVSSTDSRDAEGEKPRWRDPGRVFKSWMVKMRRSESPRVR